MPKPHNLPASESWVCPFCFEKVFGQKAKSAHIKTHTFLRSGWQNEGRVRGNKSWNKWRIIPEKPNQSGDL